MNPSVIGIDVSLITIDAYMITAFPEAQHHDSFLNKNLGFE